MILISHLQTAGGERGTRRHEDEEEEHLSGELLFKEFVFKTRTKSTPPRNEHHFDYGTAAVLLGKINHDHFFLQTYKQLFYRLSLPLVSELSK